MFKVVASYQCEAADQGSTDISSLAMEGETRNHARLLPLCGRMRMSKYARLAIMSRHSERSRVCNRPTIVRFTYRDRRKRTEEAL